MANRYPYPYGLMEVFSQIMNAELERIAAGTSKLHLRYEMRLNGRSVSQNTPMVARSGEHAIQRLFAIYDQHGYQVSGTVEAYLWGTGQLAAKCQLTSYEVRTFDTEGVVVP